MQELIWRTVAGSGALVENDGRILLILQKRRGETRWELPCGLCDAGETFEETAKRETFEETGIRVELNSFLCSVVIELPQLCYRAMNTYFRASVIEAAVPVPGENEPILAAEFWDVDRLPLNLVNPVDRRILQLWKRNPQRAAFHVNLRYK